MFTFRPGLRYRREQTLGFDANGDERRKCPQVSTHLPGPPFSWLLDPRARYNLSDVVVPTTLGAMVALGGIRALACAHLDHVNVLPVSQIVRAFT